MAYIITASPKSVFQFTILGRWIVDLWEVYLHIRQINRIDASPFPPGGYESLYLLWEYQILRMYARDIVLFGVIYHSAMLLIITVFLLLNGFYYEWKIAGKVLDALRCCRKSELSQTIVFCLIHSTFEVLISIPFYFLDRFMNQFYFGKKNENWSLILFLLCIKILLKTIGEITFAMVFILPILRRGQKGLLTMWAAFFVFHVFAAIIEVFFLSRLSHNIYPLPDGELKDNVNKLMNQMNLAPMEIKVMEVSHETDHTNAYAFEFFMFKEVVIFDTMIRGKSPWNPTPQITKDEVMAVIAHELGHLKCQHVYQTEVLEMLIFAVDICFFVITYNSPNAFVAFNFLSEFPIVVALKVGSLIFYPFHKLLITYEKFMLRRQEFEADNISKTYGFGGSMGTILKKLLRTNGGFPVYDPLYAFWYLSHPAVMDRIEVLKSDH